jgi:osmoprotectant transport system permease protein
MRALRTTFSAGLILACSLSHAQETLRVGEGTTTESSVLAELIMQTVAQGGDSKPVRVSGSGDLIENTVALIKGSIDVYPVPMDVLSREILLIAPPFDLDRANKELGLRGLGVAIPIGFKRKYGLAVPEPLARSAKLKTISDLADNPQLRFGFSAMFMNDRGGFSALRKQGTFLAPMAVKELNANARDKALSARQVDVIDVLQTDGVITKQRLRVLDDDQNYFSGHDVVLMYRLDVPKRFPKSWERLKSLENSLNERTLRDFNWRVEFGAMKVSYLIAEWLGARQGSVNASAAEASAARESTAIESAAQEDRSEPIAELDPPVVSDLWATTMRHLRLVLAGLAFSVSVGVPLGIWAGGHAGIGRIVLGGMKLIGLTPFLALLVFCAALAPKLGPFPAIFAMFVYGLWPIVSHTYLGLRTIPENLIDAATLQSLSGRARLNLVDLPLAAAVIGKGIQRCAVVNVGTAMIAALVGAGGYGEPVLAGLAEQDVPRMLSGAVPAVLLALLIYWLFGWIARVITPVGADHIDPQVN